MNLRKSAVSGSFYPNSKDELIEYFKHFSQDLKTLKVNIKPKALIVPHAGYIYSGFTANLAYYLSSHYKYKRVIVIGPSHRVSFENASIAMHENYETPLGNIFIDTQYAMNLKNKFDFLDFIPSVHNEHSTETQAPFIKHYCKQARMIEIVYGHQNHKSLAELIDYCMQNEDNLVVISTDLSHFYSLKQANYLDNLCLQAIINKNLEQFDTGCEACGMIGIKALIASAIKKDLKVELLHYTTSFEQSQDDSSVVGYCSFIIGE